MKRILLIVVLFLLMGCNNCNYIDERNDTIIIQVGKTCFYNGYEIDCENDLPYDTIPTSGNFDCNPIMKYDKDWKDILMRR